MVFNPMPIMAEEIQETDDTILFETITDDSEDGVEDSFSSLGVIEDNVAIVSGLTEYGSAATTENEVLRRIEEIHKVLGGDVKGSYFTVNGSTCTSHPTKDYPQKCNNCDYQSVMKNRLGMNYLSGGVQGWTCLGFARFVHEYVFRTPDKNNLTVVASGSATANFINQYAVPGDILKYNSGAHFAVYLGGSGNSYSVYESGYMSWGASALHYGTFTLSGSVSSVQIIRDPAYAKIIESGGGSEVVTPQVSLINISNGASYSGTAKFQAKRQDSVSNHYAVFYLDGREITGHISADSSGYFSASINTTQYTDGQHKLTVQYVNTYGSASDERTINFDNNKDTTSPVFKEYKANASDSREIEFFCIVRDNVAVSKVIFNVWTEQNGKDDLRTYNGTANNGYWGVYVDIGNHNNEMGKYIAEIIAYDSSGNSTKVECSGSMPIDLWYVSNGEVFSGQKQVWAKRTTSYEPDYAIFYIDGQAVSGKLAVDSNDFFSTTIDTTRYSDGNHTLSVTYYDSTLPEKFTASRKVVFDNSAIKAAATATAQAKARATENAKATATANARATATSQAKATGTVKATATGTVEAGATATIKPGATATVNCKVRNPKIVAGYTLEAGQKVTYDCLWFGEYPQAEIVESKSSYTAIMPEFIKDGDLIEDSVLYSKLQAANYDKNDETIIDGFIYKRMFMSDANDYFLNFEGTYDWSGTENIYHYFKYEPIKWRVIEIGTDNVFLLADKALECQRYNENYVDTTWKTCSLRKYLNDTFYNKAFNSYDKSKIMKSIVENDDNLEYGTDGGENTEDNIFLLSEKEVYKSNDAGVDSTAEVHGFVDDYNIEDEARRAWSTTYAKAMGLDWDPEKCSSGYNNSYWWLRSPGWCQKFFSGVSEAGWVDFNGGDKNDDQGDGSIVHIYYEGVRPALKIKLSSITDSMYAGTVCSDGTVNETAKPKREAIIEITSADNNTILAGDKAFININGIDNSKLMVKSKACTYDSEKGILSSIKKGNVKLYYYEGKRKVVACKIKIEQPKLKAVVKMKAGNAKKLKLSGTKRTDVEWSSSDAKVATVENGIVVAKTTGECDVIAKIGEHEWKCHVTVK